MPPHDEPPATAPPAVAATRSVRRFATWLTCLGLVVATAGATATAGRALAQAGDPALGRKLYESRCSRCHSPDVNGDGPAHRGVLGRRAGVMPGYRYSDVIKQSGIVWDEKMLDAWLSDPETLLPGQFMDVQVSDPTSRRNLIAYLATLKP